MVNQNTPTLRRDTSSRNRLSISSIIKYGIVVLVAICCYAYIWSVNKLFNSKNEMLGIVSPPEENKMAHGATSSNADMHGDGSNSRSLPQKVHSRNTQNLANSKAKTAPIVLPNVLLIGAQKAGTSSIAQWLHNNGVCHPKVFPGEPAYLIKEVQFFNQPNRYNAGIDFYSKRFEHCSEETHPWILDATPNYFIEASKVYNTYTDEKAGDALAKLKLIAILRDPVSRELSWYNHKLHEYKHGARDEWLLDVVHTNGTIKTFDEYSIELSRLITANPKDAFSLYVDHLKSWVELFGRQQLLILSYNEFVTDPSKTVGRLEEFLGVKLNGEFEKYNFWRDVSKEMPTIAKEVLGELFREKNEELYEFLANNPGPPMEEKPFPRFDE